MAAANPRTRFIAFYSYKGGVGRTLALANCARALAAAGKRIAVMDLDLEAPGLEHFAAFRPQGEAASKDSDQRPPLAGFAEYIKACRTAGPPEHLSDYFHCCAAQPGDKGEVWLMPAGRRGEATYCEVLALDWERFYSEEDGYRLVENLRGHIENELKPDYVLIDARTGLTELGGIATHQLADLVVLLFNLNWQNLHGIQVVHDSLHSLAKPPLLLLVASPIPSMPTDNGTPFDHRMRHIREHFHGAINAGRPAVIPYQPILALEERILVDSRDDPFDHDAPYRRLNELILRSLDAPDLYLDRAMRRLRENNVSAAIAFLESGLDANPNHPGLTEALIRLKADSAPVRIEISRLPAGTADFLGRNDEFELLDAAWSGENQGVGIHIVELVGPGGGGKTALVKRWLDRLKRGRWRKAERVFGWSFYSQGTGDDRQASEDAFLSTALDWLAVEHDPATSPWDKGRLLAQAISARRTLLILDGCEPLQHPPGPLTGQLRCPGLKALLDQLASVGQPGLTLVTSRESLADLAEYVRGPERPDGPVLHIDLGNLSDSDGARLLHRLGCGRAGAAAIGPEDTELCDASREVQGHALTLNLLGRYLAQAEGGDIRRRDTVDLMDAATSQGGHAFRVLAAYETWFGRAGETVELAVLRLLGFFDRSADMGCIRALLEPPPIPGLTEPLMAMDQARWGLTLSRLADSGLIERPSPSPRNTDLGRELERIANAPDTAASIAIDAHPLVREYLSARLRESQPDGWREGHRRLYEHLKSTVPYHPEGLAGLQPLYQAIGHGCLAGLYQEAFGEVYRDRVLRISGRDSFYSIAKLGAFGSDLAAVARFFDEPWRRPTPALSDGAQAWLLNQAAFSLRALGRLTEALEPMRATLEHDVQAGSWRQAAISAASLSELELALGIVSDAVADGQRSVEYAERSSDRFARMTACIVLADAMHQQGQRGPALRRFCEAESIQAQRQPEYPLLYSTQGFRYRDLLLAEPERAAWRAWLALPPADEDRDERQTEWINESRAVEQQAEQTIQWAAGKLLDIALDCLIRGRAALIQALLALGGPPQGALTRAASELTAAVGGLRAAGQQDELPRGLLSRAWLYAVTQDAVAARADLDEAWEVASRGGMKLFMADCSLCRARLLRDRSELAKARDLIEQCGYWRRRPELEDAEQAAAAWTFDHARPPASVT